MQRVADRQDRKLVSGIQIANLFLLSAVLFSALAFLYFFYYYGITRQRSFSGPMGPVFYYYVPILLGAALSTAFLLRPSRRINLVLGLLSLGITIYAVNLLLALDPLVPGVHADPRGRLEVVTALRKEKNVGVVPFIAPGGLFIEQADGSIKPYVDVPIDGVNVWPLSGISNAVTVFCNETGQYSVYKSDEHGFNNPAGLWDSKPVDVAVLGDSLAQGACLPPEKNFAALIREHYPATLNLGTAGAGPLLEFAQLEEYVSVVKPKVTLWCYSEETDLSDLLREQRSPLLKSYLKDGFTHHLFDRQADVDRALSADLEGRIRNASKFNIAPVIQSFRLDELRKKFGLVLGDSAATARTAEDGQQTLDLFQSILARARAATDSWGGRLYFVYLPTRDRYISNASNNRNTVLDLVRRQGLPLIDAVEAFQSQKDPLSLYQALPRHLFESRQFGHYNEKGYRVVAADILKHLDGDAGIRPLVSASHTNHQF